MFKQLKDLLSFKAFMPSKLDIKVQLNERFRAGEALMGILMSKDFLTFAEIQCSSSAVNVKNVTSCTISTNEERINSISSFAKGNELSSAVLLSSPGMQVLKLDQSLPKKGVDRLYDVKHTMSTILSGEEEGRVYAYVSRPKFEETLIFSYDEVLINFYVNLINNAGLEVARTSCSIYAILDYLFNENEVFLNEEKILLIYSSDALIVGSISEGRLQQIGFRTSVDIKDLQCNISRMIERFDAKHHQIAYINCSEWNAKAYFDQNYPFLKSISIFQDSNIGVFQSACYG